MQMLFDRVTRDLIRRAIRLGLLEGSRIWLVIGAVVLVVRLLGRTEAPRISTERLSVGESLVVTHVPAPPTRRQARRARATSTTSG
jgi:hypothetical protein